VGSYVPERGSLKHVVVKLEREGRNMWFVFREVRHGVEAGPRLAVLVKADRAAGFGASVIAVAGGDVSRTECVLEQITVKS
jgi:hypothetical protein